MVESKGFEPPHINIFDFVRKTNLKKKISLEIKILKIFVCIYEKD